MTRSALRFAALAALLAASAATHAQTQCWAPRDEQDASTKPAAAPMRKAVLAAEEIIRKDRAYLDAPLPVRMRTMIAIGPYEFTSARMFVNAYPERAGVNIVWRGACDIIPQADRIAAGVGQIGVFFNPAAQAMMPPGATFVPKFEGTVHGYPRYNGWIYMTKDGRLPWVPETLAARLDRLIAARQRALDEWMKDPSRIQKPQDPASVRQTYAMLKKSDPAGAEQYLASMQELAAEIERKNREVNPRVTRRMEEMLASAKRYKASFAAQELAQAAVWADADGAGRKQLDAQVQQLHAFPPEQQAEVDAANREGRALERQAQDATRAGNAAEAARLRARVAELSAKVRTMKAAHTEAIGDRITQLTDEYELTNLKPGDAAHAAGFVADQTYYDKNPNHVRLIAVGFSEGKHENGPAWMKRAAEQFDFAAVARLLNQ